MEVDEVYHLACPASPIHYQRNPVRTIRTAVEGTLEHARPGARGQGAHPDRLDLRGVRRSDRAPAARELLGERQPDRPARLLRRGQALRRGAGGVVRPPVRASRCASCASSTPTARACTRTTAAWSRTSSCRRCATSRITVYGEGQQTRSFCYATDLIEGFTRLMASEHGGDPVNLGNPRETTVLELAEMIKRLAKSKSEIVSAPLPKDDPTRRKPDITRAQELLGGWGPRVPLEEGLAGDDRRLQSAAWDLRGTLEGRAPAERGPGRRALTRVCGAIGGGAIEGLAGDGWARPGAATSRERDAHERAFEQARVGDNQRRRARRSRRRRRAGGRCRSRARAAVRPGGRRRPSAARRPGRAPAGRAATAPSPRADGVQVGGLRIGGDRIGLVERRARREGTPPAASSVEGPGDRARPVAQVRAEGQVRPSWPRHQRPRQDNVTADI